jgi:hypothetical protein
MTCLYGLLLAFRISLNPLRTFGIVPILLLLSFALPQKQSQRGKCTACARWKTSPVPSCSS